MSVTPVTSPSRTTPAGSTVAPKPRRTTRSDLAERRREERARRALVVSWMRRLSPPR